MEKVIIKVDGMQCGHCELAVADALRKIDGVAKAKASKRKKEVRVEYDPAKTTVKNMVDAINETGYEAAMPE